MDMADDTKGAIPGSVVGTVGQVNVLLAAAITALLAYRQARALFQSSGATDPDGQLLSDQDLINLFAKDPADLVAAADQLLTKYGG